MTGFKLGLLVVFVALATFAGVDVLEQFHPEAPSFITTGSYDHYVFALFGAPAAIVIMLLGFMLNDRHPIPLTFLVIATAFTVVAALARWTDGVDLPVLDQEQEAIAAVIGAFVTASMFFAALFTESSKRAAPPPAA